MSFSQLLDKFYCTFCTFSVYNCLGLWSPYGIGQATIIRTCRGGIAV